MPAGESGNYVVALLPKQGAKWPWRLYENYPLDAVLIRFGKVDVTVACRPSDRLVVYRVTFVHVSGSRRGVQPWPALTESS